MKLINPTINLRYPQFVTADFLCTQLQRGVQPTRTFYNKLFGYPPQADRFGSGFKMKTPL